MSYYAILWENENLLNMLCVCVWIWLKFSVTVCLTILFLIKKLKINGFQTNPKVIVLFEFISIFHLTFFEVQSFQ